MRKKSIRVGAPNTAAKLTMLVAGGVLAASLISEHVFGIQPCVLCLFQRHLWLGIMLLSLLLLVYRKAWPLLIFLLLLNAGVAGYQVGVEQKIFAAPSMCKTNTSPTMTIQELTDQVMNKKTPSCDEAKIKIFGISLAGFNMMLNILMTAVVGYLFLRKQKGRNARK